MDKKILDEVDIKFRLNLNKQLLEEKLISLEVFQLMENYLMKKLYQLNESVNLSDNIAQ